MLEYFIYHYGSLLLGAILCAIFGTLGHAAKKAYKTYVNDETKRQIAKTVVSFVEQAWKNLHGSEKLHKALETAQSLLSKKGIDFDAEEMEILIEAAVAEFNEAFRKPLDSENANASRDNTENADNFNAEITADIMAT